MHDADGSCYLYRVQFAAQNGEEMMGRFARMLMAIMRLPTLSKSGRDDQVASSAVSSTDESAGRPKLPKRSPGTTYVDPWDSSKSGGEPAIDPATDSGGSDQVSDAAKEQYIGYADAQRLRAESGGGAFGALIWEANRREASAEPESGGPDEGEVQERDRT